MRSLFAAALMATGSVTALSTPNAAFAQDGAETAPPQPAPTRIRAIIVEGNVRVDARTIQSFLLVEPGDPFDPNRIDLSLKTLVETGQFADVAFDQRGPDLVVRVVENPIINRVLFEGNRALNDDKLREEIQAEPRGTFTAARVQADVQRILSLYRQSGRFAAQVNPQYKPLDQGRVDLIFEITEGPVTGVRSINFIGNEVFSDGRLRSEIATKQSRLWRFFSSNDNYDPDRLAFDREQLRTFYQNRGYYDFRVTSAVADLTPDQEDFYITFTIDEGQKYNYGKIEVETTLDKLNGEALRRIVPIREGDLYVGDRIEDAIDALTFAAGVTGFAFVDVQPDIRPNPDTGEIDVTFVIDEGPRVYIERINIVGNTQTLDRVIRRELRVSEGDAFNRVLLNNSRNRVRALGFFSAVEVTETPGSQPDRTIVNIEVEEQPTGELAFSAGFSSVDNFLFDISVSQRNLRGRGQRAVAAIRASRREQLVNLQFTEPRFLDRNLSAGIDVFARRTDFTDIGFFENETIGAAVRAGFPLSNQTSLGLTYRISRDEINLADTPVVIFEATGAQAFQTDPETGLPLVSPFGGLVPVDPNGVLPAGQIVVDQCSDLRDFPPVQCQQEIAELTSQIGYTFRWDRRNDPIAPTRGFDFSIGQNFAGLGGDVQFLQSTTGLNFYRGLPFGARAVWSLSGGFIFPFGGDDDLRFNNRFFRGGNSFRGFDIAGIGPRVVTIGLAANEDGVLEPTGAIGRGQALGGQAFYQSTLEVFVPNYLPESFGIRTSLFLEAGGLGLLPDADRLLFDGADSFFNPGNGLIGNVTVIEDALTLRATAGVSIAWRSPFGPIRFDFSQLIRAEDFDRPQGFRFSTTTQF